MKVLEMRATWRGIRAFLIAWTLFAFLAHLLGAGDPTGNPVTDAALAAETYLVGPVIIGGSAVLGMLAFLRIRRGEER